MASIVACLAEPMLDKFSMYDNGLIRYQCVYLCYHSSKSNHTFVGRS